MPKKFDIGRSKSFHKKKKMMIPCQRNLEYPNCIPCKRSIMGIILMVPCEDDPFLKFWGMWNTSLLSLVPGLLWPRVEILFRVPSMVQPIALVSSVFTNASGDHGSISDRVIPKTQKMVLDASLLNTQH